MDVARPGRRFGMRRVPWVPSAAPLLAGLALAFAATAALPLPQRWEGVIALVLVFGVPHGALDGEVARPFLRPRFGRLWFLLFAVPYLALSALVLVAWRLAPMATLAGFLGLSVWHFGREDAGPDRPLEALVRGGLPIAAPSLVHPDAVAQVFSTVTATPLTALPAWWMLSAWLWAALALAWALGAAARPRRDALAETGLLFAAFALLPPLSAFGLYFACVHAPRHVAGIISDARAPRVGNPQAALRHALPITLLTLAIGATLWPLYAGTVPERLIALTIQGLAALTLPHMLLDAVTLRSAGASAQGGAAAEA